MISDIECLILNRTIEFHRLMLNRLAERLGRDNPLVIEQSERVDGLVMKIQCQGNTQGTRRLQCNQG